MEPQQLCYLSSSKSGIGLPWRVIFDHGVQYNDILRIQAVIATLWALPALVSR